VKDCFEPTKIAIGSDSFNKAILVVTVGTSSRQNPNQEDPKVSWVVIRLRSREPASKQKTVRYKKNLDSFCHYNVSSGRSSNKKVTLLELNGMR
jgi:hypothetical protein